MTETQLIAWAAKLKSESNDIFFPLFFDEHRYLVLMGGGGSGKSIFAGRKVIERCCAEAGHRWLVVRKVAKTLRESCFRQLTDQLYGAYPHMAGQINRGDMRIELTNGSEILFAGLDDVEKLKSIYDITGIWIEEASELTEGDFNQLDIRLRGQTKYYKQIIISFNPVSIVHWLKKRFFDFTPRDAVISRTTYKDNRFLDSDAINVLEGFRDTDPYYYTVYCLGQWGVLGKSVFAADKVTERLALILPPVETGFFGEDGGWQKSSEGFIRIYEMPKWGHPYVIGADTAGDGSDSFVAQVIDNATGVQVATLRHQFDEDLFSKQVDSLGRFYNNALVAIESNFSTFPVRELERLKYPNQYVREIEDTYTHKPKKSYGFITSAKNRNAMISNLIEIVRDHCDLINDETTLQEMLTFVRGEDFRPQAEEGAHDDCVMALAIAYYVRDQQTAAVKKPEPERRQWSRTMWEDYRRASPAEKKMLKIEWGEPL